MATALQTLIDAYIKRNANQEITGPVLNGVLSAIADALNTPFIGQDDGDWYEYDPETGEFVNSGVHAQGESGVNAANAAVGVSPDPNPTPSVDVIYNPSMRQLDFTFYDIQGPQGPQGTPGITGASVSVDANVGTPSVDASIVNSILTLAFHNLKGASAGFGTPTISVGANQGTPSASVTASGPDTAKVFAFAFDGLKGENGPQGPQGPQGNPGSSVDYPFTLANNLTTDDSTIALTAAMGVQLEGEISQLSQEVDGVGGYNKDIAFPVTPGTSVQRNVKYPVDLVSGVEYLVSFATEPAGITFGGMSFWFYGANSEQAYYTYDGVDHFNYTPTFDVVEVGVFIDGSAISAAGTYNLNIHKDGVPGLVGRVADLEDEVEDIQAELGGIVNEVLDQVDSEYFATEQSVNIFNAESNDIITGQYLAHAGSQGTANLQSAAGYTVSHVLHFGAGKTYKAPAPTGVNSMYVIAAFVGSDGNLTGDYILGTVADGYQLFTMSEDHDVRINIGQDTVSSFMVCEDNEYPESFVPYHHEEYLAERYSLNNRQIEQVQAISETNVLYGKSITLNGDSICFGNGYPGGYGKIIADKNDMSYENIAVGGATITSGTTEGGGGNRHWVCETVQNMDQDADYAIFEGGVNDAALYLSSQVALGALSNGYTAALEKTTFYGAMEYLCKTALTYFDHAKIGFVITHKMTTEYVAPDGLFYKAAIECLEKWGIPYINLNIECPPLAYIDSLKTEYTTSGDGWHPNEDGYRRFYVPKIEAWLRTL